MQMLQKDKQVVIGIAGLAGGAIALRIIFKNKQPFNTALGTAALWLFAGIGAGFVITFYIPTKEA